MLRIKVSNKKKLFKESEMYPTTHPRIVYRIVALCSFFMFSNIDLSYSLKKQDEKNL